MITELLKQLNENGVAYALVCALSAWLGKVWAGRTARKEQAALEEQIERLRAELQQTQQKLAGEIEKAVHIHKVQFEKEFGVYQKLMKDVNGVRRAYYTLHPALKPIHDVPEQRDQHFKPLREDFMTAYSAVRDTILDNKPFYAENVFKHCEEFILLSVDELSSLNVEPGEGLSTWQEQEEMKKRFCAIIENISSSIRERIQSVVVIE